MTPSRIRSRWLETTNARGSPWRPDGSWCGARPGPRPPSMVGLTYTGPFPKARWPRPLRAGRPDGQLGQPRGQARQGVRATGEQPHLDHALDRADQGLRHVLATEALVADAPARAPGEQGGEIA